MEFGVYQQLINQLFKIKLDSLDRDRFYVGTKVLDRDEAVEYLARYMYQLIQKVLASVEFNKTASGIAGVVEHSRDQLSDHFSVDTVDNIEVDPGVMLVNYIIKSIARDFHLSDFNDDLLETQASLLTAVVDKTSCDYPDIAEYLKSITPITSFSKSALFTGARNGVTMISELKREIASSDEIYFLVSFIRRSGLNLLMKQLREFTTKGKKLKVITTTYMCASEFAAIKEIAMLDNTSVKISYNTEKDRLHAKAYLFLRNTGYHTAYIGSSNMSKAALTEGMEWNIKATEVELPHIIDTVRNTFNTYWENSDFEIFMPGKDDERLRHALKGGDDDVTIDYSVLDLIKAHDYQKEILDKLRVEREYYNHFRNLVVAATGTGKTVIAAFDYKNFKESHKKANFLFIVHRQEIIKQACATFRQVLKDENFGEMWYGDCKPKSYNCLFASKDSFNRHIDDLSLSEDYYDYIIIDEVHHVAADSYRKILSKFKSKILLGLTATPERMDGIDITEDFDGQIAAEIRLDTALNNALLSPFRYYGVSDSVDLADVKWERGHFVASELSKVYTANDRRTSIIFKSLEKYLPSLKGTRALCFCVDKDHAKFMNAKFTLAGLKSDVLTSDNSDDRNKVIRSLKSRKINYLFVVDIFNEGVDIPEIDAVLFLRPTESLTIFLQQFGRGLRKVKGKDYLTVLDFVGHSRVEFNYTDRFRALMGRTSMSVNEEIEKDFPHLPMGCHIELEPKAKEYVLENINSRLRSFNKTRIIRCIQNFDHHYAQLLNLENFIKLENVPLEKIYNGKTTWRSLCLDAGVVKGDMSKFNKELARAVNKKWLSTDSYSYFSFIMFLVDREFRIDLSAMKSTERKMLLMLYYDLFQVAGRFDSLEMMVEALAGDVALVDEIKMVIPVLMRRCEAYELPDINEDGLMSPLSPLRLHGVYTKDQIFVAMGTSTLEHKSSCREGVERNKKLALEAMFVDIIKDREAGSTTNYNDFAQSESLFHWESQSNVSQSSKTGQNYINGSLRMFLFVRQQASFPDDKSRTMGYVYLGQVRLKSFSGNRPMKIVWELDTLMPSSLLLYAEKYNVSA